VAKKTETAIAKTEENALTSIPEDFKTHAGFGTEKLTGEDVRPPRLMLAQAMSPHVKKLDPKYIEGLSESDAFNDLTGEIYETPIQVCIITFLGSRFVEFDEAGKVSDGNVAANDPRTKWTKDDEGQSVKPLASKFYDYLIWLPNSLEVMTFSLKNKQAEGVGKTINSMIKLPAKINGQLAMDPPACARLFELKTAMEKNEKGSWAVWTLRNAGFTDEDTRKACYQLGKSFAGKNIVIEREAGEDEDVPDLTNSGM